MAECLSVNYSLVLNRLLDSLGLDEENRKRRMECQKLKQLLLSWEYDSLKSSSTLLLCGSAYETTTLQGLSSDVDTLMIQHNIIIINDITNWKPDLNKLQYMFDSTGCYGSFTKLYLLSLEYPGLLYRDTIRGLPPDHIVDDEGRILLSHSFIERLQSMMGKGFQQHGPALQFQEKEVNVELDQVIALQCNFFPVEAADWKVRQTPQTIAKIGDAIFNEANSCYLVGIGCKGSATENVEWRISLSSIERQLVHSWNNIQYKCYVMMKVFNKDLIACHLDDQDVLSSYHFKTTIMWMVEDYPVEFFVETNFEKCLITCLMNLATAVKKRSLPHYFMEGCNLFYNRFEQPTADLITSVIENVVREWPVSLFQVKRRELGFMLQECIMDQEPSNMIYDCIRYMRRDNIVHFEVVDEVYQVIKQYNKTKTVLFENNQADVLRYLLDLRNKFLQSNWKNINTQQFVSFIMTDYLCSFALRLIQGSELMSNKKAFQYRRTGKRLLQMFVGNCCINTGLEVAGYFWTVGMPQITSALLDLLKRQIMPGTCAYCTHDRCSQKNSLPHKRAVFDDKPPLREHGKYYLAAAVIYTKEKLPHVPNGLVYEMFRTTAVSPPIAPLQANPKEYDWYGHAVVHCHLYFYYLRFLYLQALGYKSQCQAVLHKMVSTTTELASYHASHRDTNHNILGQCFRTMGKSQEAFQEYHKSMTLKPHHNSAIWHLALLIRSRIRKDC